MKNFLENSRYIVLIGIAGTFIAAVALFCFGLTGVLFSIGDNILDTDSFGRTNLKELSIVLIQTIDIFLLATVLYIIALGLYELFIDATLKLPPWLKVATLDDLKTRLLGIVVVILPVTFLGEIVDWNGGKDILWLGLAIAAVLISIAAIQYPVLGKKVLNGRNK